MLPLRLEGVCLPSKLSRTGGMHVAPSWGGSRSALVFINKRTCLPKKDTKE